MLCRMFLLQGKTQYGTVLYGTVGYGAAVSYTHLTLPTKLEV